MILVKNAMVNNIYTLSTENTIFELLELMSQRGIGSVIITNDKKFPLQILTLRDIPKIFNLSLSNNKISDLLIKLNKKNSKLITIRASQHLITAMNLMNKHNISHLPVIDKNNQLVGIISMRDLLKHFPGVLFIDPLTGIHNRLYLDILKLKIEKSKMKICIFMIDIDNFKKINDEHGHSVGDIVLKNVAKTLKSNIKGFDEVIRYGGEEFLVILYICDINQIYNIAERLRKKVKQIKIPKYESILITVSIGAYSYERGEDIDEAIKKADIAMYQAKKAGKDRVSIYENQ